VGIGTVSRPAVFLDRDGVLVEEIFYSQTGEWEAPLRPEDVRLIPGAAAAARRLAEAGYALVLISNQAAYAKGKTDLRSLWLAHERFVELLASEGMRFDAVFYSYGHPDGVVPHFSGPSLDRKPGPYNLFIAAAQLDLDLALSWMIGDRESDVACARAAGVRAILVENVHMDLRSAPTVIVAKSLWDAVRHIGIGVA
jgi:D-glycero-D-manno-heptose 1,7-bisphosphate phosphatase